MDDHLLRPVRGNTVKRRIPSLGHAMAALDTRRPQQIAHHLGLDLIGDGDLGNEDGEAAQMPGKFVVKKGTTGKFRFNLLASNGQVIAASEAYETRAACLKGIESVRKHAPDAAVEDLTATKKA